MNASGEIKRSEKQCIAHLADFFRISSLDSVASFRMNNIIWEPAVTIVGFIEGSVLFKYSSRDCKILLTSPGKS